MQALNLLFVLFKPMIQSLVPIFPQVCESPWWVDGRNPVDTEHLWKAVALPAVN